MSARLEPDPGHSAVTVRLDDVVLEGNLDVPFSPIGAVAFAHGSGSSRHSPRNQFVAEVLNGSGVATMLFDLLTPAEAEDRTKVFDIDLLARRLTAVTAWLRRQEITSGLPVGLFGASTGAAAALRAAAADPTVAAVVSRGGRPDLAGDRLAGVTAPTLLIVGGDDQQVLALNREAASHLGGPNELVVVPGASHLFAEPGTLAAVARLAADWFAHHLGASEGPARGPGR